MRLMIREMRTVQMEYAAIIALTQQMKYRWLPTCLIYALNPMPWRACHWRNKKRLTNLL